MINLTILKHEGMVMIFNMTSNKRKNKLTRTFVEVTKKTCIRETLCSLSVGLYHVAFSVTLQNFIPLILFCKVL